MYVNRGFQSPGEFEDYLNGVVISNRSFSGPFVGANDLNGLTIIINDGGDNTVTFSGDSLTLNQVVDQINVVVAGAAALRNYGRNAPAGVNLVFVLSGLVVKETGTANIILGLPTAAPITVTAVVKSKIVAIEQDHTARIFWVLHEL